MTVGNQISRGRRIAASASLVAAGVGWLGAFHAGGAVVGAFAGVIALAGIGVGRRSVLSQVLGRGVAWLVLCSGVVATLVDRHVTLDVLAMVAGAGAALLLSRPLLHTERALREFAPVRFRRSFLAAATGAVTFASVAGAAALELLREGEITAGLGWLAVTAGLFGAAVGVVRMRAWGVLVGAFTTATMLLAAAAMPGWREMLLMLAAPGAMLALPVVLARLGAGKTDPPAVGVAPLPPPAVRVAAFPPPAVRVAGPVVDEEVETIDARAEVEGRAGASGA